jgi:RHS repeat-associated protein
MSPNGSFALVLDSYNFTLRRLDQVAATYDASDRTTNPTFTYDLNGNLTRDVDGTTYAYDTANRLTRTVKGSTTTDYFYDALGNLIRQRITNGTNVATTSFVLDEGNGLPQVIGEVRSDGTETLYAYGAEGLHARRDITSGGVTSMSYPLLDGLGSVRHWTKGSDGSVQQSLLYDAWGMLRHMTGSNPAGGTGLRNGLGFTGEQQRDDGTVHLRARAYQPQLGRFLQRDSFGGFATRPQSLNRYAYVEGNPVNWTDPSGYSTLEVHDYIPKDRDARATLEAAQRAARKNAQANRPPTVTTTVRDRTSGKTWSSGSGQRYPSRGVHPAIQGRLPNPSMRPWPCTNCGEPNALSRALHEGANPKDLDMASVETRTGRPVNRCLNCQVLTPQGVRVVTDHPTRGSIPPTFRKVKGARAFKRAAQALPGVGLGIGIATDPANATECGFRVTPGSVGNGLLGEIPIIGEIFAPERAAPATVDDARRMGLIP